MTKIEIDKKVSKWLDKLEKRDITTLKRLDVFLDKLANFNGDPRTLGRKVESFHDGRWRWRVGDYRIIGLVKESGEVFIIQIIKIAPKGDKTYKDHD